MGKYSINTEKPVKLDYVKTRMLVSIANELAEANRLKRLEIWLMDVLSDFKDMRIEQKDLEDQA